MRHPSVPVDIWRAVFEAHLEAPRLSRRASCLADYLRAAQSMQIQRTVSLLVRAAKERRIEEGDCCDRQQDQLT